MCKLKKKPNQQLEPSARPSSGRGNAQMRRIPKKISPARLKRLLQNNTRPSCQACMDRRGAFDLLIGSVAKDGETLAKCASIFIEHGFPLMPVATPARMPTPLHLIGSVAKHGETLAKCTSIFIEHGFPLMPVATPARMPTPLHAAAARGLHKLLNVLLAMDGAVDCFRDPDRTSTSGTAFVSSRRWLWQRPPAR